MSHRQWAGATRDLLALGAAPDIAMFTPDPPSSTSFDNNGGTLVVSPGLRADYELMAEQLASDLVADAARLSKVTGADWPSGLDAAADSFVTRFGERAFRRPLSAAERTAFVSLFKRGGELFPGDDPKLSGVRLTVQAMLMAPAFLYRVELGEAAGGSNGGVIQLTGYEIASRLSFMLWDSGPDELLMEAAKAGRLGEPDELAAQARRLLQDPRATDKLAEFHRQLLELDRYDEMHPKDLSADIGASMRRETERFVRDVVVENEGGLAELLTAPYGYVNAELASLYGVTGTFGSELTKVSFDGTQRAGLMTQAGFLAYRSGDTAPILRGVFINDKLLCAKLPPPPVFEPPRLSGATRRERIDSITGEGTCGAGCHAQLINPAGFPLEFFDDAGRYRAQDNGRPVDGKASYPFRAGALSYDGPIEWSRAVADSAEAHECYVKHWIEFGFGRSVGAGDAALITRVGLASRERELSVRELLVALVQSPTFRTRKLEQP